MKIHKILFEEIKDRLTKFAPEQGVLCTVLHGKIAVRARNKKKNLDVTKSLPYEYSNIKDIENAGILLEMVSMLARQNFHNHNDNKSFYKPYAIWFFIALNEILDNKKNNSWIPEDLSHTKNMRWNYYHEISHLWQKAKYTKEIYKDLSFCWHGSQFIHYLRSSYLDSLDRIKKSKALANDLTNTEEAYYSLYFSRLPKFNPFLETYYLDYDLQIGRDTWIKVNHSINKLQVDSYSEKKQETKNQSLSDFLKLSRNQQDLINKWAQMEGKSPEDMLSFLVNTGFNFSLNQGLIPSKIAQEYMNQVNKSSE